MKTRHLHYHENQWQSVNSQPDQSSEKAALAKTDLVIAFLSPTLANVPDTFDQLRADFPDSIVIGCSTGGQIQNIDFFDDKAVAVAISFDNTPVKLATIENGSPETSFEAGKKLATELKQDDLTVVFILSEGLNVNGSNLVQGLKSVLPPHIPITGGLAGDGADFSKTMVGANSPMQSGLIAAIGFYGDALAVHHSYGGGWKTFGPERIITRSEDNVLYELDGRPALEIYKRYLGEEAKQLPGSALLYPLQIWHKNSDLEGGQEVVRTILGIDEDTQSMTFAGNMPEGFTAQLMSGTYDNIIHGATEAATTLKGRIPHEHTSESDSLALIVSCIGRKLMLGQRVYEEIEEVHDALTGKSNTAKSTQIGFYSYGELCPHLESGRSELHNQTMTITHLSEK